MRFIRFRFYILILGLWVSEFNIKNWGYCTQYPSPAEGDLRRIMKSLNAYFTLYSFTG